MAISTLATLFTRVRCMLTRPLPRWDAWRGIVAVSIWSSTSIPAVPANFVMPATIGSLTRGRAVSVWATTPQTCATTTHPSSPMTPSRLKQAVAGRQESMRLRGGGAVDEVSKLKRLVEAENTCALPGCTIIYERFCFASSLFAEGNVPQARQGPSPFSFFGRARVSPRARPLPATGPVSSSAGPVRSPFPDLLIDHVVERDRPSTRRPPASRRP